MVIHRWCAALSTWATPDRDEKAVAERTNEADLANSRPALEDLMRLVTPPIRPVDAGQPNRWDEVEQALGTALPSDYKQFISAYGTGEFNDLFFIFNPFSRTLAMNLLWQAGVPESLVEDEELGRAYRLGSFLNHYHGCRCEYPDDCPLAPFPEPGGLLPLGGDSNGGSVLWLMVGPCDEWPVVRLPHALYPIEKHEMTLAEFLFRWLSGELPGSFGGAGRSFARSRPLFQTR
jgi:SMI1-KNR4 cell-wall